MSRNKILPRHYEAAYKKGIEVYENKTSTSDALNSLEKIGLKPASAYFYITNLRSMLKGKRYHRGMSVGSTDKFLEWIHRDFQQLGLSNAVRALVAHIGYNMHAGAGLKLIAEKYRQKLAQAPQALTAVDDLGDVPPGNASPDRGKVSGFAYKRDPKVRDYVRSRAKGMCEHCASKGFPLADGSTYVEVHHVIALASEGRDTVDNVIGLCANHHREAHFGANAKALEEKFIAKLKVINRVTKPA